MYSYNKYNICHYNKYIQYTQCAPSKPEGMQECSTFNFIFIYSYLWSFFKDWTKHNFFYIWHNISIYSAYWYFYLIFRSIIVNNINLIILHSVRAPFRSKWGGGGYHTSTCRSHSTNSGCESCDPWWWLLASQEMKTSVWSRATGDTYEYIFTITFVYHQMTA